MNGARLTPPRARRHKGSSLVERLSGRLSELRRDSERGAVMFITAAGMTVVVGMGALAIDTANWYQKHHATQLATDAAALAAANCLANAGESGVQCTTTTDTTDAAAVATTIAADNGVTIPSTDVTFNGSTVTVKGSQHVNSMLAEALGLKGADPNTSSSASWGTNLNCTSAGPSCYAIFAYDATCNASHTTGYPSPGVTNNGNKSVYTGGVHSNGNIYNNGNSGNANFPSPNVTWGSACPTSDNMNPGTNAMAGSSTLPYPLDYSGLSPAAASNDVTPPNCTYTAGVSPATTGVTWDPSTATLTVYATAPSGVYCNPTGAIDIGGNSATGGYMTPGGTTYIARSFSGINSINGMTLSAYNNAANPNPYHLLIYQESPNWNGTTCSSTDPTPIDIGGNTKDSFYGVVYGPCTTIYQTANNTASDMFLEAYDVNLAGNSFTGAGPFPGGDGATLNSGVDMLTQ